MTRLQILELQGKCSFLNQTTDDVYVMEYMNSLSIFENSVCPLPNCGIKKLVPLNRYSSFTIEHFYATDLEVFTDRNHFVFIIEEHIKAGYAQFAKPLMKAKYYTDHACFVNGTAKFWD